MSSVWDLPSLQPASQDYIRLDAVGDGFDGTVIQVLAQSFDDGSVSPQIVFLDDLDGAERSWTAGQIQSKRQLAELRPDTGDHLSVRLTGIEKRGGGKTLKHIDIKVNRRSGEQPAPAPVASVPTYTPADPPIYATNTAPAAPPAEPAPPAGVAPEVWNRMDQAQRQAMLAVLGNVPAF